MFKVIATRKDNNEKKTLGTYYNGEDAEKFCEMWGWSYDDGRCSYWLDVEKENK